MEVQEKRLEQLQKEQRDEELGVTTESLNRMPVFQPTLQARFEIRSFENKYGKGIVEGRLGQAHKNVLETIFFKRKAFATKPCFKILYDEYEVRRHLSQGSEYNYETYLRLIEDMKTANIKLEIQGRTIEGTLIKDKYNAKNYTHKTKSNLPALKGKKIPYAVIELGDVTVELIKEEIKFKYDPKPIMTLSSGISQAIVRFLKTHRHHPEAGYHLKELVANLTDHIEGQNWRNIKRLLKKDADKLESLGIVIDFEKERLYVVEK